MACRMLTAVPAVPGTLTTFGRATNFVSQNGEETRPGCARMRIFCQVRLTIGSGLVGDGQREIRLGSSDSAKGVAACCHRAPKSECCGASLKRQRSGRARFFCADRLLWILLYRIRPQAINAIVLVKPPTLPQWRRSGFRCIWR